MTDLPSMTFKNAAAVAEIDNARSIAGPRYRRAVEELRSAYVELAAIDRTIAAAGIAVPTFSGDSDPWHALGHPEFAPAFMPAADEVAARTAYLTAWLGKEPK